MKLGIILGSTREGRATERLAKWVVKAAQRLPDTQVELLDLRDYPMPFFAEKKSPKANPDRHPRPVVNKWLDKLQEKDAYVFVTPEYNHAMPAVLKNAIDYTDWQFYKKPAAVVSHGSTGGARATSDLKVSLSEARGFVIPTNVAFTHRVSDNFDEEGNFIGDADRLGRDPYETLQALLEELKWYSDALANARSNPI